MQQLYSLELNAGLTLQGAKTNFNGNLENTFEAFLLMLYCLRETANYVATYEQIIANKLVKDPRQEQIPIHLLQNRFIEQLNENERFNILLKQYNIPSYIEEANLFRELFHKFKEIPAYSEYSQHPAPEFKQQKNIIGRLIEEVILPSERLDAIIEDHFVSWDDDYYIVLNMVRGLYFDFFKRNDGDLDYCIPRINWKELNTYGHDLIVQCYSHRQKHKEMIEPRLLNWDMERVNMMDLLLVRMTLTELLHFPNIPVKVSLNEYVEVSKIYSSPRSREFINGILDRLMKELKNDNKIQKAGRGLVE